MTLPSKPPLDDLPSKLEILHLAECIGYHAASPSLNDRRRAKTLLLELGDEVYRQRDEIERLREERDEAKDRLRWLESNLSQFPNIPAYKTPEERGWS